jgi:hypothetical protein
VEVAEMGLVGLAVAAVLEVFYIPRVPFINQVLIL